MTRPDERIVIVDGARTPIGNYGGVFKDTPAHELGAVAARAALARSAVPADAIGEVVMGCIGQVGPDAYNARRVALAAGLPVSTPAYTVGWHPWWPSRRLPRPRWTRTSWATPR